MSEKANERMRVDDTRSEKAITGMSFLDALEQAGVIRDSDRVRRVVIDAKFDEALIVYVERFGDSRLLQVTQNPEVRIALVDKETDASI